MKNFTVRGDDAGKRTDVFVAGRFPGFARSALRGLFERGMVLVNGKRQEPGDKLRDGDKVSVDEELLNLKPDDIDLEVIYEDDDVIVVNKPAGTLSHSKGALNVESTVASFLQKKITDPGLSGNRAGIVHRLDRQTSGVLIGAKNAASLKWLQKQFSSRRVKKTYEAVVHGKLRPAAAMIDVPIERNPKAPQTFRAGHAGKEARTAYKVLKSFTKDSKAYSLVKLEPVTGRTHQLRVHLSYLGHPVVGDIVYGQSGQKLLLHAKSLELTLPSGERHKFSAPLPKYFKEFMRAE